MKEQKIMAQMKGQDKTPEKKKTKWSEDRQSCRKRNQNDSEDDSGSQKKNGDKDWEDARNVYQRPRRTKEQTEMNNTSEGINSRITKAEEWINGLEDRMVEITAVEQNIEKRMKKKWRHHKRTSGTTLNTTTFAF